MMHETSLYEARRALRSSEVVPFKLPSLHTSSRESTCMFSCPALIFILVEELLLRLPIVEHNAEGRDVGSHVGEYAQQVRGLHW